MNRLIVLLSTSLLAAACGSAQTPVPATPATTPAAPTPGTPIPATPIPTIPNETASPAPTLAPPPPSPSLPPTPLPTIGPEINLVTHDSFAATASVIKDFERQTGTTLNVLKGGDAGTMVNEAILTKSDPLGDVLYGVDNTFLSRALDAGIFEPYISPASANVPATFKLDPQDRVTPIDYGDVCVVYDVKAVGSNGGPAAPQTINDLTNPAYNSKLVVENPATSSPGLAFMLATIARFGESGAYTWLDYWRDLRANGVLVESDWNSAYYNDFSAGGGNGDRNLVVSYATDPAADVYFSGSSRATPGVQFLDDGCFRQEEFAAVLAGGKNPAGAEAWIDFMASPEFQSDIPLNMFVLPVNPDAQLPDLFTKYQSQATSPLTMDPATIAANRDQWIQQWTDTVLH